MTGRSQSWGELEGRLIEVCLLEYLSALGIVDVAVEEYRDEFDADTYLSTRYFRFTPLGAYVLGVTDHYDRKESSAVSGLIV